MKQEKYGWVVVKPDGEPMWWSFAQNAESAVFKVTKNYPMRDSSGRIRKTWATRVRKGYAVRRASMTLEYTIDQ